MPHSGQSLEKPPPDSDFRSALQFYLIDCTTLPGKLIDILIVFLNMAVCAILVVETYPVSPAVRELMWQVEIIIVAVFILEYMARLYGARDRIKQMRDIYSIIDLVTILPTLILVLLSVWGVEADLGTVGVFRALRIFRILRFFRFTADPDFFFGRITYQVLRVLRLFLTIIIIFFISSILFYEVEHPVNASVSTFTDAFYFTVVALTTVGFGDITPLSEAGKWVTILMILSGIILIPWQISRIVKEWIHIARKRDIVCTRCGPSIPRRRCLPTVNPAARSFTRSMMAGSMLKWPTALLLILLITGAVQGAEDATVAAGRFSAMTPGDRVPDWEPMTFDKIPSHTRYSLVTDNGRTVLRADSQASASGLVRNMTIDPDAFPVLTWDWKISNTMVNGDVTKKSGDDYAARIYITFSEDPGQLSFFQRTKMSAVKMLYGENAPVRGTGLCVGEPGPGGVGPSQSLYGSGADDCGGKRSDPREPVAVGPARYRRRLPPGVRQ